MDWQKVYMPIQIINSPPLPFFNLRNLRNLRITCSLFPSAVLSRMIYNPPFKLLLITHDRTWHRNIL